MVSRYANQLANESVKYSYVRDKNLLYFYGYHYLSHVDVVNHSNIITQSRIKVIKMYIFVQLTAF